MVVINLEEKLRLAAAEWNKIDREYVNKAEFSRYNGGWVKKIIGLNKSKTNGYSLLGDFVKGGDYDFNYQNGLYLDCSISGSRKNQKRSYHLFKISKEGNVEIIECLHDVERNYAVHFWSFIEAELSLEVEDENVAAAVADLKKKLDEKIFIIDKLKSDIDHLQYIDRRNSVKLKLADDLFEKIGVNVAFITRNGKEGVELSFEEVTVNSFFED